MEKNKNIAKNAYKTQKTHKKHVLLLDLGSNAPFIMTKPSIRNTSCARKRMEWGAIRTKFWY